MDNYPLPGSHAERVLKHIISNPGITKNKIIHNLELNPSVVRGIMKTLLQCGLVSDAPDDQQYHHYSSKVRVF